MDNTQEWWQSFFSGLAVEAWLAAVPEDQTKKEADFIQSLLEASAPAKLLDVPCGGGRLSLELASRGFQMTGVDISADFLTHARAEAARRHLQVEWSLGNMGRLQYKNEFDGAFCFGNSFGYFDDAGNAEFLHAVAAALKPGALFALETSYLTESLLQSLQARSWYKTGDILWLGERRYDHLTGRLHVDYTWIRHGRTEQSSMSARLHTFREISRLFEAAGFVDAQSFSSLAREPFQYGCPTLIMAARKAG